MIPLTLAQGDLSTNSSIIGKQRSSFAVDLLTREQMMDFDFSPSQSFTDLYSADTTNYDPKKFVLEISPPKE